ncbi:CBS domain-containing protein [Bacillus sp. JJ1122]|uniref:CBS domain-containing protein n=1 Tax=Bacillus sp. JJ1122 TaxID=3122951 RepID=UPI0030001D9A
MANDTQVKDRSNKKQTVLNTQEKEQKKNKKNSINNKDQQVKEHQQAQTKKIRTEDDTEKNTRQPRQKGKKQNGVEKQEQGDKRNKKQISNNNKSSERPNGTGDNRKQRSNGNDDKHLKQIGNQMISAESQRSQGNKAQTNETKKQGSNAGKEASNDENAQEVNHKEQSGKFETAFNRIHKALREMVKETESDAFVELLYSGYKNHSLIRKYKSDLHQFAKLRNAIVHERVNADFYIAEPHIEVVERIEEICREFEKPQTALSIATSPVFYYYEDAYLKDVLKVINKFDFTRFPVYDKDDKYVALLTSTEIIQWMAKHFSSEVIHFEDVRIKELLTKGKNYFVTFVTEDASLYEIEELFERYHTRGKKLQAVIITETGDRHGKPIGVITPWDLLDSDTAED